VAPFAAIPTVFPVQLHDVTLCGTCRNRISEERSAGLVQQPHNSRDGRKEIPPQLALGDYPREPLVAQKRSPGGLARAPLCAAGGPAHGSVRSAPGDAFFPSQRYDTGSVPASSSSVPRLPYTLNCNSAAQEPPEGTTFRGPLADKCAVVAGAAFCAAHLDHSLNLAHAALGPREVWLPNGQVSDRRADSSPRRFYCSCETFTACLYVAEQR
jgi:hypothetical protein